MGRDVTRRRRAQRAQRARRRSAAGRVAHAAAVEDQQCDSIAQRSRGKRGISASHLHRGRRPRSNRAPRHALHVRVDGDADVDAVRVAEDDVRRLAPDAREPHQVSHRARNVAAVPLHERPGHTRRGSSPCCGRSRRLHDLLDVLLAAGGQRARIGILGEQCGVTSVHALSVHCALRIARTAASNAFAEVELAVCVGVRLGEHVVDARRARVRFARPASSSAWRVASLVATRSSSGALGTRARAGEREHVVGDRALRVAGAEPPSARPRSRSPRCRGRAWSARRGDLDQDAALLRAPARRQSRSRRCGSAFRSIATRVSAALSITASMSIAYGSRVSSATRGVPEDRQVRVVHRAAHAVGHLRAAHAERECTLPMT